MHDIFGFIEIFNQGSSFFFIGIQTDFDHFSGVIFTSLLFSSLGETFFEGFSSTVEIETVKHVIFIFKFLVPAIDILLIFGKSFN